MRRLRLLLVFALLAALLAGGEARAADKRIKELPELYQRWLASVELLISKEEREAFLALEKDYQRDAFIERFWRERDPYPETARNEFRERWEARVEEAMQFIGSLDDERAKIFLLNGQPDALIPYDCMDLWPGQVWYYQRPEGLGTEIALLFYQLGRLGRFRLWTPLEGIGALFQFRHPGANEGQLIDEIRSSCSNQAGEAILAVIQMGFAYGQLGYASMVTEMQQSDQEAPGEWVAAFNAYSTEVPEGAGTFEAELQLDYPGRHKARTVVQGLIRVAQGEAGLAELAGHRSFNFVLTGEVLREDKLFDNFRYAFNIPATLAPDEPIALVFERYLRPGDYFLALRLEDLNGKTFYSTRRELAVPQVEAVRLTLPEDPETARLLAEANAAITSGETTIKIVPPRQMELQTGLMRVDTLSTGEGIAEVTFSVDGKQVLTKRAPPFSVEVDLGSLPRMRTLTVIARDAAGAELARDVLELNAGTHRFAVRLLEPKRGKTYVKSLRAEAQVDVPQDKVVERVEFYLNEDLMATLYQPPFVQPILLPPDSQMAYVRAVAYQPDGNSTEDLVFVNAPDYLEELEVQFVELYIAVLDKSRRPVSGLALEDFRVLEDGVEQRPIRFDLVDNLPIHAGILLDVSASMEERLETARRAALRFFEQAITPRDRATLITFNDHPNLAAKFTNDIQTLAGGLAGLDAERGTALYDSLIFSLYYFNGIKGQRALVLLSDGKDEHSRFSFDNTLEYARRAGVAIYAIGLALNKKHGDVRKKLNLLSDETGGRAFFVDSAEELPAIYDTIQRELRSRYYLAYQSSNASTDESFRTIDVELARPQLEAKTLRGYYP